MEEIATEEILSLLIFICHSFMVEKGERAESRTPIRLATSVQHQPLLAIIKVHQNPPNYWWRGQTRFLFDTYINSRQVLNPHSLNIKEQDSLSD